MEPVAPCPGNRQLLVFMLNVSRPPGSNPGAVCSRRFRCAMSTALTESSVNASAISAMTSVRDNRRLRAGADARTPSLSASLGKMRTACQSGARLNSTAGENRRAEREEKRRPVDADSVGPRNVIRRHGKNQAHDRNAHDDTSRPRPREPRKALLRNTAARAATGRRPAPRGSRSLARA